VAEKQLTDMPTKAAPNSRTTRDSEQFTLLAVNATFDGSAATAAWLPAVEIVSDSGVIVARHVTEDTVAAGGDAEVTFAPFLRKKAGGGGAVTAQLGFYRDTSRAITPANNDTSFDFTHIGGAALLDLTFPTFARFAADGSYTVTVWTYSSVLPAQTGKVGTLKVFSNVPFGQASTGWATFPLDAGPNAAAATVTVPRVVSTGDFIQATMCQNAVASLNYGCDLTVAKIG
jgi:hypothetical protein